MSLAGLSPHEVFPAVAMPPSRVIADLAPRRVEELLAALRDGRLPVFARWPDPRGATIIGSARSATGAAALALDGLHLAAEFERVRIEFELPRATPPVRLEIEAWIPV